MDAGLRRVGAAEPPREREACPCERNPNRLPNHKRPKEGDRESVPEDGIVRGHPDGGSPRRHGLRGRPLLGGAVRAARRPRVGGSGGGGRPAGPRERDGTPVLLRAPWSEPPRPRCPLRLPHHRPHLLLCHIPPPRPPEPRPLPQRHALGEAEEEVPPRYCWSRRPGSHHS